MALSEGRSASTSLHRLNAWRDQVIGLCVLWPGQLALTGYLVYLIIQHRDWLTQHVGTSYAPTLALSILNVAGEFLAEWGLLLEVWHPRTKFIVRLY